MTTVMPLRVVEFGSWRWLRRWSLIVLVSVTLILAGCGFASFVAAAEADVPVVVQMVTNITNYVAPSVSPAIQAAGTLAIAGLTLLCGTPAVGATMCDPSSLIGQSQATPTTTTLRKIDAALTTVNQHITDMLTLAKGLPANVGAAIVAGVGIALATVTSLIALIPAAAAKMAGNLKTAKELVKASGLPKPDVLKKEFNAAIGTQYPAAIVR